MSVESTAGNYQDDSRASPLQHKPKPPDITPRNVTVNTSLIQQLAANGGTSGGSSGSQSPTPLLSSLVNSTVVQVQSGSDPTTASSTVSDVSTVSTAASTRLNDVGGKKAAHLASLPKSEEEILKKHRFSHIGNYVLYDLVPGSVDATLHATQFQDPNVLFICKVIPIHSFTNAVRATLRLDSSQHVCTVKEVYRGPDFVYMFYDTPTEDLHAFMRQKRRLRESEAKPLFKQIVSAVADCHEQGVIIRDVKLRKFVFTDKERSVLKLESLDGAYVLDAAEEDWVSERVGCLAYVSPEVLLNKTYSGRKADVWSLGVVLYAMLVGRYPFYDGDQSGMLTRIKSGAVCLPESLSYGARAMLRALLQYDPGRRLSAADILKHPWFSPHSVADDNFRTANIVKDQKVPEDPLYDSMT